MKRSLSLLVFSLLVFMSVSAVAQTDAPRKRVDVEAVQGVLAVQGLDGWLLADAKGRNPIAAELVIPEGPTNRQWFYYIPSFGQPSILVHKSESSSFTRVPGKKIEYTGYRDLLAGLRSLLKGSSTIAMEYAPKSGIRSLTRVDQGTVRLVKKTGVSIQSSANLVQFTKSLWGPEGRFSHYLAVHHLDKLRQEALQFVAERVRDGRPVSEHDVQEFLENGFRVRGLVGNVSVAAGRNTAKPNYQASARSSASIQRDQLLLLELSGAASGTDRPIFASLSWMAFVGETVPARYHKMFETVRGARDAAVSFIQDAVKRRRLVMGFEADQAARSKIGEEGLASRFLHRTGHSLDTSLEGDGANLDDYETHDTRNLVVGSGFTVGPGVYVPGDFGVRSIINLHLARKGVEVTTPVQTRITPILRK
jgi:Xaa-Pro aminopeptidase